MLKKLTNETSFRIAFKAENKTILDAGYWILDDGYWILNGNYPYFIKHQVSSIASPRQPYMFLIDSSV
jgi:hypothetical protein